MKATISLEKYIIKLKGNNKEIFIPLDPREGNPWVEASYKEDEKRKFLSSTA